MITWERAIHPAHGLLLGGSTAIHIYYVFYSETIKFLRIISFLFSAAARVLCSIPRRETSSVAGNISRKVFTLTLYIFMLPVALHCREDI